MQSMVSANNRPLIAGAIAAFVALALLAALAAVFMPRMIHNGDVES
jgi:hypothetical protein